MMQDKDAKWLNANVSKCIIIIIITVGIILIISSSGSIIISITINLFY